MDKLISFSLWGNDPKYTVGAVKNVKLAKEIYPDYKCRFYVDILVPVGVVFDLEEIGAEVISVNKIGNFEGMFYRFYAINEADIVLVRDVDSRLSFREKEAVDEWLKSDKLFHSIHDHPCHQFKVMPGLMGFKKSNIDFKKMIDNFDKKDHYGIDYCFFESIFDLIKDNLFYHDSMFGMGKDLPSKRNGLEFCGKIFDANENTVLEHELKLKQIIG